MGLQGSETKRDLLKKQAELERQIAIKDKCVIGVGYTVCTDVSFSAVELFQKLGEKIEEIEKESGKEITATNHVKIEGMHQFLETFVYYFSNGVNSEKTTDSLPLFMEILGIVKTIEHREEIGGHSAQWIHRA